MYAPALVAPNDVILEDGLFHITHGGYRYGEGSTTVNGAMLEAEWENPSMVIDRAEIRCFGYNNFGGMDFNKHADTYLMLEYLKDFS